jgi:hypothetical protein
MIEELKKTAIKAGDELIGISALLDKKMSKWSDALTRPQDLSITECVGFINKETATDGLNLSIDIQAPAGNEQAVLRTWGIMSQLDDNQIERFDNIQLDFAVDYQRARELAKKGGDVTRDDIRTILHDQSTKLTRVVVSNQSGLDAASQQILGERYDLSIGEPGDHSNLAGKIVSALNVVLPALKKSAIAEGAQAT